MSDRAIGIVQAVLALAGVAAILYAAFSLHWITGWAAVGWVLLSASHAGDHVKRGGTEADS